MVYVFKTSVTTKVAVKKLAPALDKLSFINKWNFDLEDCDNIFRVEGDNLDVQKIIKFINSSGFDCEELE